MSKQIINVGVSANDKSGDPIRTAAQKINGNFNELYLYLGNGTELTVAAVAKTGSYNSLVDKPNMALYQLKADSFSGRYEDLSGRPTSWDWNFITNKPDLTQFQTKSEAFSGNYSDLTNRPDLSIYQLKSQTFSGNYADLTNKPTLFSGSYADLTNKPTLFSGSYTDLTNKPNIPADLSELTDNQGLLNQADGLLSTQDGNGVTTGAATSISVSNNPNVNWVSTTGITSGDMTLDVTVDELGNATITIVDGGTGHAVGETNSIAGTALGGTSPEDDLQYTIDSINITPVALPLDKGVLKLSDGRYTLADGQEGQIIRLVMKDGVQNPQTISVTFANGRVNGTKYQNIFMEPFAANQPGIVLILFTDGAWQSSAGLWD